MDAQKKTTWLTALRGGEFQQTTGQLRSCNAGVDDNGEYLDDRDVGYCCLGVFLQVAGDGHWESDTWYDHLTTEEQEELDPEANYRDGDFSEAMLENYGLTSDEQAILVAMNDGGPNPNGTIDENGDRTRFHKHSFAEIADWIEGNL